MQSKYSALESRSKELISQQGSAVSGASVALGGLGERLNQLVEQLISSYSISEQELEVRSNYMRSHHRITYHNHLFVHPTHAYTPRLNISQKI